MNITGAPDGYYVPESLKASHSFSEIQYPPGALVITEFASVTEILKNIKKILQKDCTNYYGMWYIIAERLQNSF